MNASWPVTGKVDYPLLKSADYLAACAHEFRVRIESMKNPKGKTVRRRTLLSKTIFHVIYIWC